MDFEDTPEEAAFRAEARAFLEANAERRKPGAVEGYRRGQDAPGAMDRAKDFQRRKPTAGFVGIHWPKEWGGRGGTQIQNVIYNQEEAQFDVLSSIFGIGIHLAMPTICVCGTPEQRDRFVQPTMRADDRVVPVVLGTVRRVGPRLAAHARRTRRRRVGDQRPEDLELRRALQRFRHPGRAQRSECAEACRADLLHPRHEDAGRGGAADPASCPVRRTSTRCSSPTCAFPTRCASALSAAAGASR